MKILVSGLTRKTYAVPILVFLIVKHKNKQILITVRIIINDLLCEVVWIKTFKVLWNFWEYNRCA